MNQLHQISPFTLRCKRGETTFTCPAVMGILNATPDSFYDGGRYNTPELLLQQARHLLATGADILDLGVMSSRPGAAMLSPADEAAKLAPLVALLRAALPEAVISVDTCQSLPAARAVEAGADIVNDISGGQLDPDMLATVASLHVPYILMHMRGTPATMQLPENTRYNDIVDDLSRYFDQRLDTLHRLGASQIILDPGLGFAKTVEQNLRLLGELEKPLQQIHDHPSPRPLPRTVWRSLPCPARLRTGHPCPQHRRPPWWSLAAARPHPATHTPRHPATLSIELRIES